MSESNELFHIFNQSMVDADAKYLVADANNMLYSKHDWPPIPCINFDIWKKHTAGYSRSSFGMFCKIPETNFFTKITNQSHYLIIKNTIAAIHSENRRNIDPTSPSPEKASNLFKHSSFWIKISAIEQRHFSNIDASLADNLGPTLRPTYQQNTCFNTYSNRW